MSKLKDNFEKAGTSEEISEIRRRCDQLSRWAFTDFERARKVLDELSGLVVKQMPFDIRLAYHAHSAFLHNQWHHYDKAVEHSKHAVTILESLAKSPALAEMWADLAAIHLNRRDWRAAEKSLDKARRYMNDSASPILKAHLSCREGFLHLHLGNHRQALDCLMEAEKDMLNLDEETAGLKDYYIQTLIFSGLGDLYERLGEKAKSLEAYRCVLPIVERHGLRPRLSWHYLNAGRAAMAQQDVTQAQACFEKAMLVVSEGESEAKTHALGNLGILALWADNTARALALFDKAAAEYENPSKPGDFTNLSKIESWRAGLFSQLNELGKAQFHLEKAWETGQNGHDLYHLSQIAQNLAALHGQKREFEKAYDWQRKASELATKHYNQLRDREREEIEARHQLEHSRQEAQMARLRVASLQLRALRAQMNPHFMFNALNAIQGLITSGKNNEAESYLAKFAKMMRHTLEYSDLEVVTLEQEIEFLERYLDINRKLRFRDKLEYSIIAPRELDQNDLFVPTMILQPFVENAIEHGIRPRKSGHLRIEFHLSEDSQVLRCIIEDDGVGYNQGRIKLTEGADFQSHRSRGMEITRERLTLLHQLQKHEPGDFIRISDLNDLTHGERTGTRVEVLLPVLEAE
ncbi:MAG: histidine kinase [Saprospiraceae bacterium]|nr:histidine kinase [Saprospiraceae bacterium]